MHNFLLSTLPKPLLAIVFLSGILCGQQPIDLFPDEPALNSGFIRIGSWNLRHINLENGAEDFLPGTTAEEDFTILTATFAKAIQDLGLDLVAIQEYQPRAEEPDRLFQVLNHLNGGSTGPWRSDHTSIDYDNPADPFGNLQFAVLWNSSKVTIDPNADTLLTALRQPRNPAGELTQKTTRIPWLVPVQAGDLSFDLLVLHFKSGGGFPQAEEVNALEQHIRQRQSSSSPRHLIVCGDWNIRPDQQSGRQRLQQMRVSSASGDLMRILTVADLRPTLEEWDTLGPVSSGSPLASLVPFSHFNSTAIDTFLDHVATSRTLDEIFDNPIQVRLAGGIADLRPGIHIAVPLVSEGDYVKLTDHLPIVLTLRTSGTTVPPPGAGPGLSISGALPNPVTDDVQDEEVHIRNSSTQAISLAGWKIGDGTGSSFWELVSPDGVVQPGATVIVKRRGRPMFLNNSGDLIVLINPTGASVDQKSYGNAPSGHVFVF